MPLSLEQLPDELLLSIGDHLANQPLRPCSRNMMHIFDLQVDAKWSQYDPQRVSALWQSFRPIRKEYTYDLVLMPFEAYCAKHRCERDAHGTPSIRTLEVTDSAEEALLRRFDPLDASGLQPDEVDEMWYLHRHLIPPNSRYNYPACWRCGCLVCDHSE